MGQVFLNKICSAKDIAKKMTEQVTEQEKIFAKHVSNKEGTPKICKRTLKCQQENK